MSNEKLSQPNYEAQKAHAEEAYRKKLGKLATEASDSGLYIKEDGTPGDLWEENLAHNANLAEIQGKIDKKF